MGEDQDAAGARGLDEADCGDRLAGAGRVLEPEAPRCAGVLGRFGDQVLFVVGRLIGPVLGLLVGLELVVELVVLAGAVLGGGLGGRGGPTIRAVPVPVAVRRQGAFLDLGHQGGERSRKRVDLVVVQLGAVQELRRVHLEHTLEAEHQRVLAAPLGRGLVVTRLHLGQRVVQGAPSRGSGRKVRNRLAFEQDGLPRELLSSLELRFRWGGDGACSHVGGVCQGEAFSKGTRPETSLTPWRAM